MIYIVTITPMVIYWKATARKLLACSESGSEQDAHLLQ